MLCQGSPCKDTLGEMFRYNIPYIPYKVAFAEKPHISKILTMPNFKAYTDRNTKSHHCLGVHILS